jgi:hypothetical protein
MKQSHLKIIIDVVMTVAVLVLMEPRATGLSLHEWGGLIICVVFMIHTLLNWKWVIRVARKFFKKLPIKNRVNYILDALLIVGFFLIVLSGIAIARTIDFAWLTLPGSRFFWRSLHLSASLVTLIAAGIHVGLHWNWVLCRFKTRKEIAHA